MARVVTFTADLLFGSRVQGSLAAAGEDVELVSDRESLRAAVEEAGGGAPEVLVVDLTDAALQGAEQVRALRDAGALSRTRTLGFYSHVEADVRERAQRAGFDLIVPPPGNAKVASPATKAANASGASACTSENRRSVHLPASVSISRASSRGSRPSRAATTSAVSRARSSGLHHRAAKPCSAARCASSSACRRPVSSSGTGCWPWHP